MSLSCKRTLSFTHTHTHTYIHTYIYIYILENKAISASEKYPHFIIMIIIMSRYQHGYPWSSLATSPYCQLLPAGLQGYIPYLHRAAVWRFEPVVLPLKRVHRSTSLMSSSLLLQQCPAYLVRLILIIFVMGGKMPYSCCFVKCCLQDLFNIARSIFV